MPEEQSPVGQSAEPQADAPPVEAEKDENKTDEVEASEDKPVRTRVHRGQTCPITRTTRNVVTGAIYDLIEYTRNVTNRRTGESKPAIVGIKLRRPGTGVLDVPKEVEVEEDEL